MDSGGPRGSGADAGADSRSDVGVPRAGGLCGNGVIDADEACDDRGMQSGDGCSASCAIEIGWRCTGAPSQCVRLSPELTIAGSTAAEGDPLVFRVALSWPSDEDVTFDWATAGGSATPDVDFRSASGVRFLPAGQTETFIEIQTLSDTVFEPRLETVQVVLFLPRNAVIRSGTGTGVIAGPPLFDRGVVVRYFFDEQSSGPPSAAIRDTAPSDSVDLQSNPSGFGPEYLFVSPYGHGLRWTSVQSTGWVGTPVLGTKLPRRIHRTRRLTAEILVDLEQVASPTRLIHLGGGDHAGAVSLVTSDSTLSLLRRESEQDIIWSDSVVGRGPVLLTLTYDSQQVDENERLGLYYNGEPSGLTSDSVPQRSEGILVEDGDQFLIGNASMGLEALSGWIGYVALYDVALTSDEVRQNAHRLLLWSDGGMPQSGP